MDVSKYRSLIQELESSSDSSNTVAKRHSLVTATAYNAGVRSDLLGPSSARLGFSQVNRTDVPDNIRAEALAQVLAGRSVKEVASETGVPAPTLYQMARKAREKKALRPLDTASNTHNTPDNAQAHDTAVLDVLTAQLQAAAAQLNTTPAQLLTALSARPQAGA